MKRLLWKIIKHALLCWINKYSTYNCDHHSMSSNLVYTALVTYISYVKSIYSKDTSPQWCCHYNISDTSLSSIMAILLATYFCSINATIQVSSLPWQEYSYWTWSSIAEFSYPTPISVLPLILELWTMDFILFFSFSIFFKIYFDLRLGFWCDITITVMVSQLHDIEDHKRFWNKWCYTA